MPSPVNPFPNIALDLSQEELDVLAAFTNAELELQAYSAPPIGFLELQYDGVRILRAWDSSQVSSLPQSEQYRLYAQLGGLFNAAMRALLYP